MAEQEIIQFATIDFCMVLNMSLARNMLDVDCYATGFSSCAPNQRLTGAEKTGAFWRMRPSNRP
jgi:hypothetical protein